MTVFVSLPMELLSNNLSKFWNQLEPKLRQEYPKAHITSNYTGDGTLESSDVVLFLYEYRHTDSCKKDMERCKELDKTFNFFTKFYAPDRYYYPLES